MAEPAVEYVTFGEIATDSAMRPGEFTQAREDRLQELLKLFLVGKSEKRLGGVKRKTQHSEDLEAFDRDLFYQLFHAQIFVNREIGRHTSEETPPYWQRMAAVKLSDYPPAAKHEYVANLAVSIPALRTWARRHGPGWLIQYLENRGGSVGSVVDECRIWLDREIGRAERDGRKLKKKETFEAAHEKFSRLKKRDFDSLWSDVPKHLKFAGRPSQADSHT